MKKEEFTSTGGSTICLGRYKHRTGDFSGERELLNHSTTSYQTLPPTFSSGLSQTKFGKGFTRRQQHQIQNPLAETEMQRVEQYKALKSERSEKASQIRAQLLAERGNSGYDIISGAVKDPSKLPPGGPKGGIKCFDEVLGPEAPSRGKSMMRETEGRYFAPLASGKNHEHRQAVLYNEGLLGKRYCGILEAHKKDLPSYGIEDQFSKSEYMKTSDITRNGLYEARVPGKYTPRKVPNNPSGNDKIVEKWNTDIDLSNRTLRGIL